MQKDKASSAAIMSSRPAIGAFDSARMREILPLVCLLAATLWYAAFKVGLMHYNPGYTPVADKGMFWSETAFQYRYAKLFAENDPQVWRILKKDVGLQYPDGVDTWRDYTTFMEPFDGMVYRLAVPKSIPFHAFLLWFVALFSSLTAFLIYAVCRALWNKKAIALAAALSWMLMPASFMRQVSAIYLKEDFSLQFVASFILLFVVGIADRRRRFPLAGSVALFVALASWHLSQFFFLMLMGCVGIFFVMRPEWERHWTRNILFYLAAALVAGCLLPVLRYRAFVVSQGMLITYALLLSLVLLRRLKKSGPASWRLRAGLLGGIFIVLALAELPFAAGFKEYAHVFELFIYKIRYLNVMPADPTLLPFEARVFWAGDFVGATMGKLLGAFKWYSPCILFVLISYAVGLARCKLTKQEQLLGLILCGSLFIYWLVDRLSIFLAPMLAVNLCVAPAVALRLFPRKASSRKARAGVGAVIGPVDGTVLALLAVIMAANFLAVCRMQPVIDEIAADKTELFDWLRANTSPDDPILSNFPDGPMLLLYTGRPVILNSQYENTFIRKRTQEFNAAYFGGEEQLYAFCQKYGARWLCVRSTTAIETKPGSDRFGAARIGPLPANSAAALIQFAPRSMVHFAPAFDNSQYRVMQVLLPGVRPVAHWKRGYCPRFDPSLFEKENGCWVHTDLELQRIAEANQLLRDAGPLFSQMVSAFRSGAPEEGRRLAALAREKAERAAVLDPRDFTAYSNGAILEAEAGDTRGAVDRAAQALMIAPSDAMLQQMFFDFASRIGDWGVMELAGKKLLEDPDNADNRPFLHEQVALAALSLKDYAVARRYADSALIDLAGTPAVPGSLPMLYYIDGAAAFRQGDIKSAGQYLAQCMNSEPTPEVRKQVEALAAEMNGTAGQARMHHANSQATVK